MCYLCSYVSMWFKDFKQGHYPGCADFAEFFFSNQFMNEFLQFIAL